VWLELRNTSRGFAFLFIRIKIIAPLFFNSSIEKYVSTRGLYGLVWLFV